MATDTGTLLPALEVRGLVHAPRLLVLDEPFESVSAANIRDIHGETDCLENAGRLPARVYARATMVTTLSPCDMCTGAILLYKIPKVIIGENSTFYGGEAYLRSRGVDVVVLDDAECVELMTDFIAEQPHLWNEDIGEEQPADPVST